MKPEDLKVGDALIFEAFGGRKLEIIVKKIDFENQRILADFGPIPFSNLSMLKRK